MSERDGRLQITKKCKLSVADDDKPTAINVVCPSSSGPGSLRVLQDLSCSQCRVLLDAGLRCCSWYLLEPPTQLGSLIIIGTAVVFTPHIFSRTSFRPGKIVRAVQVWTLPVQNTSVPSGKKENPLME